jgi:hypothetical protein
MKSSLASLAALKVMVVPAALLLSGGFVYQASTAAFSATTDNPNNQFQAGNVSLADDDTGSAMFNVSGMVPGSTGNRCIEVKYTGNVASTVALYGTSTGNLGQYLNVVVETGTGKNFASGDPCGALTGATQIYSGTLAALPSTFATGVPAASRWAPSANGATRVYKITYTLADNNSAQGQSANATFTWEAQSA